VKIQFVVFWVVAPRSVVWLLVTVVSEGHAASLKMEAAWSSEATVTNHYTSWRNNPENHEL